MNNDNKKKAKKQKNENLPGLHIFRMLKETCRIYNTGSLPVHTLESYLLQRPLGYTNYYTLTKTDREKLLENTCVTGVAFSLLPTFKILFPPLQDMSTLCSKEPWEMCPEAKCPEVTRLLEMVLTHLEEELRTLCKSLSICLYCNLTSCA